MKTATVLLIATALSVHAAPLTFDFKDPKGVNNIVFRTDAPLESINGTATGISGTVTVDPESLEGAKGKIVVATDSLNVPNPMMKGHLVGDGWLDAKKYPEITFEIAEISDVKKDGDVAEAKVKGPFTLHGVTKEIAVDAKVTYLPGKLADRTKVQGDLLVIRSKFTIKRSDYGIKPGESLDKVSDEVEISLSIAGAAARQ